MRSKGGVADGGAGVPSEAEADTVEPVVAVESVSCVELLDRRVDCGWSSDVRRCCQDFCRSRVALDGYGKNRSENGVSCRRNRPAAGTAFGSGERGRNTSENLAGRAERPSILRRGSCVRKS